LRRKDREIKEVIALKDIEGKYGASVSWERLEEDIGDVVYYVN
jgi:hypothetical protein